MFEYAVGVYCGDGILLDYGVCDETHMNVLLQSASIGSLRITDDAMMFCSDNDFVEPLRRIWFRPAAPDCTTGK